MCLKEETEKNNYLYLNHFTQHYRPGVNILPNVRIRYPGTIIGHREESLSAQNADTDFFQTCYKMSKKNSKLQFQHIKNRNIHFKVSLY